MADRRMTRAFLIGLFLSAAGVTASAQDSTLPSMATFWRAGDQGERLELRGQVVDTAGRPLAGATVYVRQADGSGVYSDSYQGRMLTDRDGTYVLRTVLPGNYGGLMHIHMTVVHESGGAEDTRVLFKDDPNLPPSLLDEAIVLDETSIGGDRLWMGNFDVVLGGP